MREKLFPADNFFSCIGKVESEKNKKKFYTKEVENIPWNPTSFPDCAEHISLWKLATIHISSWNFQIR